MSVSPSKTPVTIFWFRRDLRLDDNRGLFHALSSGYPVLPVFLFDENILNRFNKPFNAQVEFIHSCLQILQSRLKEYGSTIVIKQGTPEIFFNQIAGTYNVKAVYTNEDYELSACQRDAQISNLLKDKNISFHSFKDQVIFAKDELVKADRTPYTVFTPYSRRWKQQLQHEDLRVLDCSTLYSCFYPCSEDSIPSLSDLGFTPKGIEYPPAEVDDQLIAGYDKQRDFPALNATTRLGIHLRFGTISIRQLVAKAKALNETFLNELIWRDFYHGITFHYPYICEGKSFKTDYDNIIWRNNMDEFAAWCEGRTGYPIVDAGMRQLNETGFMHNRVRMIAASFLIKHLLIDWRLGEAYFANKLLDFDFAANNGGWQWAASSGCDAVPYFRIFNPQLQTEKFDKDMAYIRRWLPEYGSEDYPKPIVDHQFARQRVLSVYAKALQG